MTIVDALPWLNLLLVPMSYHVLRTESRLTALETTLRLMLHPPKEGAAA